MSVRPRSHTADPRDAPGAAQRGAVATLPL